ncbi:peptidase family T4 [Naematelia encephala]|uniref:Peptidase family T4 n=1 Tax=Naematelia encephala TaxID=71784 RepID=A0A1Y2AL39_9TREE|nr:peptidase family T4 [Naematelia encephala]
MTSHPSPSQRSRIRDVVPSLIIGRHSPGRLNCLTDVPGVLVHTESLRRTTPSIVNTGVTTILPRKEWFHQGCHAAIYAFNGCGEMTGSHWLNESGILFSPIVLTNSFAVGACHTGIFEYAVSKYRNKQGLADWGLLPVVAETYDGYLSDIGAMAIKSDMTVRGIENASHGPVPEGNTGGGTGMMCHRFKGGTGSSSRVLPALNNRENGQPKDINYTVAALVQANYGSKRDLKIGGIPIGRLIMREEEEEEQQQQQQAQQDEKESGRNENTPPTSTSTERKKDGSIIVVLATDAPLHPTQLKRLATRATVGLARVGGWGSNSSGDIFLAFSTAAHIPIKSTSDRWIPTTNDSLDLLDTSTINSLFEAVADCVEEAIYNALTSAEDTQGPGGVTVKALPLDRLRELMKEHYVSVPFV